MTCCKESYVTEQGYSGFTGGVLPPLPWTSPFATLSLSHEPSQRGVTPDLHDHYDLRPTYWVG